MGHQPLPNLIKHLFTPSAINTLKKFKGYQMVFIEIYIVDESKIARMNKPYEHCKKFMMGIKGPLKNFIKLDYYKKNKPQLLT